MAKNTNQEGKLIVTQKRNKPSVVLTQTLFVLQSVTAWVSCDNTVADLSNIPCGIVFCGATTMF